MATRSLRPTDDSMLSDWESMPERAPSIVRADRPTVARTFALIGFFLIAVGGIAILAQAREWRYLVSGTWGLVFATTGLALILFHAFADSEIQVRRLYGFFTIVCLLGGAVLRIVPTKAGMGAWFLPYGVPLLALGFLLALAVLRNETDAFWHALLLRLLGALGALGVIGGVAIGLFQPENLPGEGIVLIVLGTFFLGGFVGMQGLGSDTGYYTGIALGFFAVGVLLLAILRSANNRDYFIPSGLTLVATSILHFGLALGICSDHPYVVLTRRELAAFFYSPIAYLVLLGTGAIAGILFFIVMQFLVLAAIRGATLTEGDLLLRYLGNGIPIIAHLMIVPVLTMRLLSEEKRSGTLEMLLTVPLNETSVALAKFTAVLIFWLLTWLPYFLFFVALRVVGGEEFDYAPLLGFGVGLVVSGSGLLAMGLFFSSITRNQIIAAVLTFVAMLTLILAPNFFPEGSNWEEIANYASFMELWRNLLRGDFAPRYLVFHLSAAVFFLYLTVKVLEARKWK